MRPEISILVPVYNAGDFLERSVEELCRPLEASGLSFEILLCDDASRDISREVMTTLRDVYPQVKIFFNGTNRGLGATLRFLFSRAQGAWLVYLDADLPFGPDVVGRLKDCANGFDVAVASRYLEGPTFVPWARRVTSFGYALFCRVFLGIRVRDIGSGAVLMKRDVPSALELRADGFDIHAEFFARCRQQRFKVCEIAVPDRPTPQGGFGILRHGPGVLYRTWRLRRLLRSRERGRLGSDIPALKRGMEKQETETLSVT